MTESAASPPVERVTYCTESHFSASKHTRGPGPFLDVLRAAKVQRIHEGRVGNVKLIGVDADDWAYWTNQILQNLFIVSGPT